MNFRKHGRQQKKRAAYASLVITALRMKASISRSPILALRLHPVAIKIMAREGIMLHGGMP